MEQSLDLNLLVALDILLTEGSVTKAAARLNRSVPATSRMLGRLRAGLNDPVFVRAGRSLVPTVRAEALRPRLRQLIASAEALLRPDEFRPREMKRTFVIRTGEDGVVAVGGALMRAVAAEAPGVALRFAPEGEEDVAALRDGSVDLDIGAPNRLGPEIKTQELLRDRFVGVARAGAPLFDKPVNPKRFAEAVHIAVSRRGLAAGPIDAALTRLGLQRQVALIVPSGFAAVVALQASDWVASVPGLAARTMVAQGWPVRIFDLPVPVPAVVIAQSWHPRLHDDSGHRWLRDKIRQVVRALSK